MYSIPSELIHIVVGLVAVMAFVGIHVLVLVYAERKGAAISSAGPAPMKSGRTACCSPWPTPAS